MVLHNARMPTLCGLINRHHGTTDVQLANNLSINGKFYTHFIYKTHVNEETY